MATIKGAHHIAFTVTDAAGTAKFYEELLGMQVAFEGEDETVRFRILVHPECGWVIGVRQYLGKEDGRFDEFRVGLDHFAFTVETREQLEEWERTLAERGVPYTPIAETPIGSVVVFRDPDNIQLEFWLPAG